MLIHFDDCAGIGGFALAAQMAGGIETKWAREIDEYARAVYARHFPAVTLFRDVRESLPAEFAGHVGLYTAGFPCQPVSVAGKRKGAADDRWLWPWIAETVRFLRPDWILLENVPGLITHGLDGCLDDLEAAGYACWPLIVGADDVGAPHRRKRVWIVAYAGHRNGNREPETQERQPTRQGRIRQCGEGEDMAHCQGDGVEGKSPATEGTVRLADVDRGGDGQDVADAESGCRQDGQAERGGKGGFAGGGDVSNPFGPRPQERCQSQLLGECEAAKRSRPECWCGRGEPWCCDPADFPDTKSKRLEGRGNGQGRIAERGNGLLSTRSGEPDGDDGPTQPQLGRVAPRVSGRVDRVAKGIPKRVDRLRCLGNAIVPQCAAEIMRAIVLIAGTRP